jgi:hypothetical protein
MAESSDAWMMWAEGAVRRRRRRKGVRRTAVAVMRAAAVTGKMLMAAAAAAAAAAVAVAVAVITVRAAAGAAAAAAVVVMRGRTAALTTAGKHAAGAKQLVGQHQRQWAIPPSWCLQVTDHTVVPAHTQLPCMVLPFLPCALHLRLSVQRRHACTAANRWVCTPVWQQTGGFARLIEKAANGVILVCWCACACAAAMTLKHTCSTGNFRGFEKPSVRPQIKFSFVRVALSWFSKK